MDYPTNYAFCREIIDTVERLSKQAMVGNRRRRLATVAYYKMRNDEYSQSMAYPHNYELCITNYEFSGRPQGIAPTAQFQRWLIPTNYEL